MASTIDHLRIYPSQSIFERTILFMGLGSLENTFPYEIASFFPSTD